MAAPEAWVHGGAWDIPIEERSAHAEGCRRAAEAAGRILAAGGTALAAVVAAVEFLEADGTFDAGDGAVLTSDGTIETDAGVMDGASLRLGAVAAVPACRHPVRIARRLLDEPELSILAGPGARRFAEKTDVWKEVLDVAGHPRERRRFRQLSATRKTVRIAFEGDPFPKGTVGAVARDARGNTAAAVSTGGTPMKPPGRVGDSPIVGCGFFADDALGAASCTGFGETILRVQLAKEACRSLVEGNAETALASAFDDFVRRANGVGGVILLGTKGPGAVRWNTPTMAWGRWTPEGCVAECPAIANR